MRIAVVLGGLLLGAACGKKLALPAAPTSSANGAPEAAGETDVSKTLERLTQAVRKYAAETRNAPKSFDELVAAGYLPEAPQAPPGKKYVIDDQLRVQLK
jgi:hypothetical protein